MVNGSLAEARFPSKKIDKVHEKSRAQTALTFL
jgi:hypothetical protein